MRVCVEKRIVADGEIESGRGGALPAVDLLARVFHHHAPAGMRSPAKRPRPWMRERATSTLMGFFMGARGQLAVEQTDRSC